MLACFLRKAFLQASLIPLRAITPIKDDICASDHCESFQVDHVLYLNLTSHFCSHHCGQLNRGLLRSQLTGLVVCRYHHKSLRATNLCYYQAVAARSMLIPDKKNRLGSIKSPPGLSVGLLTTPSTSNFPLHLLPNTYAAAS